MKFVIQRVTNASCTVEGNITRSIQKEEDKKLNLWIDGQPKIHASFRSKKKPIRVEVNNKRIPVVYKQSQLSIKLVD